jgi:hypothetical protein
LLPVVPPSAQALAPFGAPTPRVRVRDALRRLIATPDWPDASWTVRQNRLLDEVGSDLRPLVALLVRAGEGGVADGLPATPAAWPAARGSLIVALTAHSFLLPEMARWAVECWGYATGLAVEEELTVAADARVAEWRAAARQAALAREAAERAAGERAAAAEREVARRAATPAAVPPARCPLRRPAAPVAPPSAPRSVSAGLPGAPSGAPFGAPVGTARVGGPAAWAPRTAPARRRRGRLPEGLDNPVAQVSLAGIAVFVGYVLHGAARLPMARASEVPRTEAYASGRLATMGPPALATAAPARASLASPPTGSRRRRTTRRA